MHNWNDHYDQGFRVGHILMMLAMVILVALFVWAILSRNRHSSSHVSAIPSAQSAQNILNERFAKGEISEDEFKSRSEALKAVHAK